MQSFYEFSESWNPKAKFHQSAPIQALLENKIVSSWLTIEASWGPSNYLKDTPTSNCGPSESYDGKLNPKWGPSEAYEGKLNQKWGPNESYEGKLNQKWGPSESYEGKLNQKWGPSESYDGKLNQKWGPSESYGEKLNQKWGPSESYGGKLNQKWGPSESYGGKVNQKWGPSESYGGKVNQKWGPSESYEGKLNQKWGPSESYGGKVNQKWGPSESYGGKVNQKWGPSESYGGKISQTTGMNRALVRINEKLTNTILETPIPMIVALEKISVKSLALISSRLVDPGMETSIPYEYLSYLVPVISDMINNDKSVAHLSELFKRLHNLNTFQIKITKDSQASEKQIAIATQKIRNNLFTIDHFERPKAQILTLLDRIFPQWDTVSGYRLTGSLIPFLLTTAECRLYAPKFYGLKVSPHQEITILGAKLFFPIASGVSYDLTLGSWSPRKKFTFDSRIPMSHVIYKSNNYITEAWVPIIKGTDLDLCVDNRTNLERVARECHKISGPHTRLRAETDNMWSITMDPVIPSDCDPYEYVVKYLNFYDRQIYYSEPLSFLTHHVCPVRGCMIPNRNVIFEIDPSCLYSLQTKSILNYYYFKSKHPDRGPFHIISKYEHRGFKTPNYIRCILNDCSRNLKIKGLPFGIII